MSKARVSSGRARTCCHIRVSYGCPSIGYTTRFLIQFYLYLQHTATLSQQLLLKHLVGVYCVCILAWTVCRAVFTALTPTQDTALKGVGGKLRRGCTSRTGVSGRSIDRYELGCRSLPDLEVLCAPTMHIVSTATQHHHHHHHHHYHHHHCTLLRQSHSPISCRRCRGRCLECPCTTPCLDIGWQGHPACR